MNRSQALIRWFAADNNLFQFFTTVTGVAVCAVQVRPVGTSGTGLAILCLLVWNSVLLCTRLIPESRLPLRPMSVLLVAQTLSAAALLSLDRSGSSSLFAFFAAGQAGHRLPPRTATTFAVFTSVLCAGVLYLPLGDGHQHTSWYLGALTGAAVLLGQVNGSHAAALRSARAAAEQAERASRSEARAQALAERARIARDVHDVLAHTLAGVNMQLEVTDALLESGDVVRARQSAQRAQSLVREGLAEVQRTVRDLREDALPLVETLRSMLRFSADTADTGTLRVDESPRELPVRSAQAIVRCAQEALTNAHKYAPGAAVSMHLEYRPCEIVFEVLNAAPPGGARPLAGAGSGMGLVGMRERLELVGGTVRAGPVVDGDDAGGWRVHVVVPT